MAHRSRILINHMFALRLTLAIIFTLIGVAGVILPVLQGWPFLILAFLMFFPRHRLAEKTLLKIETRAPRVARLMRRLGVGA